ncbi:MAG TPA: hypothetical protein VNW52_02535 [Burkholderiaceae bacterium]|nr:hypothetical protein [Burkholderiaceae bacterium]
MGEIMWVIFVEAATAMFVFVFIVWWTMFSGKDSTPPSEKPLPKQDEANN